MPSRKLEIPAALVAAPDGVYGDIDTFQNLLDLGVYAEDWKKLHAFIIGHLDTIVQKELRFYANNIPPEPFTEDPSM